MKIIPQHWQNRMEAAMNQIGTETIDVTTGFNLAVQWLICRLTERGIPFKLYNLGAGVKRVTTETNTCPCRKRPL